MLAHLQFAWMVALSLVSLVWLIGQWRGRSDRLQERDFPQLESRLAQAETLLQALQRDLVALPDVKMRVEQVATRSHEAINRLNGLPETLNGVFLRRDVADLMFHESIADRRQLHVILERLQADLTALRSHVDLRRASREGGSGSS